MTDKGKSLLSKGITEINGLFQRGDTVELIDSAGRVCAKGMSRYSSKDLGLIAGKHSDSIELVLGYDYGDAVVHRNDMVVL